MHLRSLQLTHFKNYPSLELEFAAGINCITGPNGSGKTNLLDAIHFLSLTKSAFHSQDVQSLPSGQAFYRIAGQFIRRKRQEK
ncbi:MAG: AAA family ATPase [Cytophagales bacterium]|nr:AAA family ATPase [Cytophagales bacterium]